MLKSMPLKDIKRELRRYSDKAKAKVLRRFFKTGPGEYAEGDIFLGVTVPALRKLAKQFQGLKLKSVVELLRSPIHEERLLALLILILKYRKSDADHKLNISSETSFAIKTKISCMNWQDPLCFGIEGSLSFRRSILSKMTSLRRP
jgi:DNA alkylation repair enzyme